MPATQTAPPSNPIRTAPGPAHSSRRRALLFAAPRTAFTAACAFAVARLSAFPPASSTPPCPTLGDDHPADSPTAAPTAFPADQAPESTPRRAQPLPLPPEDDRAWLQEWLDLLSLPSRRPNHGC